MLLHQVDPARASGRIAGVAPIRAEWMIAHEPSDLPSHAPASEPHVSGHDACLGAGHRRRSSSRRGERTLAGRAAPYLEGAGFIVESHRAYVVHYPPDIGYDIPRVALGSLRPVLVQHGLASDDEMARLDRELEEAKHRTDVQWVSSPLMFEWIARSGDGR